MISEANAGRGMLYQLLTHQKKPNFAADIFYIFEDIKPNAALGPDEIPIKLELQRNCKEAMSKPIHI